MKITKAVIPCGGLGTRFLPFTKAVAKEMMPIIDKPCLDYIVDELVSSGITDIMLIVSPGKEVIGNYYSANDTLNERLRESGKEEILANLARIERKANFTYAVQERPDGSGYAMLLAEKFCGDDPFVVALGDDMMHADVPVARQLMDTYEKYGKTVFGVQRRKVPEILRYGVIDVDRQLSDSEYLMKSILEKPKVEELTSDLASLGRYVVAPGVFDVLRETPIGKGNELQFTDGLNNLTKKKGGVARVFEGVRYDIGDKFGTLQAITEYALRDPVLGAEYRAYLENLITK